MCLYDFVKIKIGFPFQVMYTGIVSTDFAMLYLIKWEQQPNESTTKQTSVLLYNHPSFDLNFCINLFFINESY